LLFTGADAATRGQNPFAIDASLLPLGPGASRAAVLGRLMAPDRVVSQGFESALGPEWTLGSDNPNASVGFNGYAHSGERSLLMRGAFDGTPALNEAVWAVGDLSNATRATLAFWMASLNTAQAFSGSPFSGSENADGVRFCDEGADFRNYTYAKYGREILNQPHQFAWQIFDQQVVHLQRDEYRIRQVTKVTANTIEELADKMAEYAPVDKAAFLKTVADYNAAVQRDIPYNPTVKDGRTTKGLAIEKTNWAMPLEKPPYEAYCTTCGVTFTFGGVRIDTDGRVLDTAQKPIAGLYAAGELVGGLFYHNYPGGTGLVSGSVFGKIAGTSAGKQVGRNA